MGTHFSKHVGGGGGGHHNGVLSGHEIMAYAFLSGTQADKTFKILDFTEVDVVLLFIIMLSVKVRCRRAWTKGHRHEVVNEVFLWLNPVFWT